jgi:hypothetical protein
VGSSRAIWLGAFDRTARHPLQESIMRITLSTVGLISVTVLGAPAGALADDAGPDVKLGEHPAIIARRVIAAQGYDYASKFYPHPAWLYLSMQAPDPGARPAGAVVRHAQPKRQPALDVAATRDNH